MGPHQCGQEVYKQVRPQPLFSPFYSSHPLSFFLCCLHFPFTESSRLHFSLSSFRYIISFLHMSSAGDQQPRRSTRPSPSRGSSSLLASPSDSRLSMRRQNNTTPVPSGSSKRKRVDDEPYEEEEEHQSDSEPASKHPRSEVSEVSKGKGKA